MASPNSMVLGRHLQRGNISPSATSTLPSTPPPVQKWHSPRLAKKHQSRVSSPILDDNFFDEPEHLLTPRSLSSTSSPPLRDKAAAAASNIKKVRLKIMSKAAARKKGEGKKSPTPQRTSTPPRKRTSSSASHKRTSSLSSSSNKATKQSYRGKNTTATRRNRDNFFDDDNDDDDDTAKAAEEGAAAAELFDDKPEDDEENKNEPVEEQDEDMVGRHREVFMERAFGGDDERADNVIVRPQEELDEIIFVLEHWEVDVPLKSIVDPEHFCAVKAFCDTHKPGYKWVKLYFLQYIELPDGTKRKVLRRKEPKRLKLGRIVVSRENVFDAINEWHHKRGHLGQERTHAFCRQKYYNCTQDLVRIYCETCYICMKKNPTVTAMKGSRKPIRSNGFRDRFQIDLIDFRKMRKRDPFGIIMQWIVTIKDHSTGFTHVSAIPRKTARFVAHRLQEVFGLIGYPSIFHTDNGKEFTARRILHFLRSMSPNIITVTGRPRQPSDQGSVESMNRLVKRLIGSELAERRVAGENPNWTEILGAVMSSINSQHGRMTNSVSAYQAIYGQTYDQDISCSLEEARECWTVEQRLKVRTVAMA